MRAVAVVLVLAVLGCGGGKATAPNNNTGGNNNGGGSTSNAVGIGDNFFDPSGTTVATGVTVTWTWNGAGTHNVTFDDTNITGSGDKANGGSFQKGFSTPGTYAYHCTHHPGMTGSITVQ